ncbi:MAG TPA: extracellular solute-binding protein [Aliidongia sp.]|nr:extracellular solute-binding protein [Aliidongia sp.]
MADPTRRPLSRRRFLGAAGAAAALQLPFIRPSYAARSLKVSTFGGYFERSFADHVYPAFTKATGIEVQSVGQPEGVQFLFQLIEANKTGNVPLDICCNGGIDVLRGRSQGLWRGFEPARVANIANLSVPPVGAVLDNVPAMSWYMTFVVNPEELTPLPDSWTVLWDKHPDAWGIMAGSNSPILEITAKTYFGGTEALMSKEGIDQVIAKIAGLKPNTKLWWQDEGTMQTALLNDEVAGGTYMHDTAIVMVRNGTAVRSIFPREGAVESTNYWCQPSASAKIEEAQLFLDFMSTAEAQELIARYVGSAPVMARDKLGLTDAEFAAVSSDIPSIPAATEARYKFTDYMEQQFTKMVMG